MKHTIVALSIVVLGFTAAGCAATEDSGASGGNKKNAKPDMNVQATKIMKEFEANEAAADAKYKGKTLQVSGVIDKIDTEVFDDEQYVVQVGGGTQYEFFTVNCDDQVSKDVAKLKKGQKITVVGGFEDGGDLGVELEDCAIK